MSNINRCEWSDHSDIMRQYHDNEWGIPVHDDKKLFEYLMLEVLQCGLNWKMMLVKRDIFNRCFDNFDYEKVSQYTEEDITRIMETPGMIRSRRKIEAIIHNAKRFIEVQKEFGSFDNFLWSFTDYKSVMYAEGNLNTNSKHSDAIALALKKRCFKFLGTLTVYAYIQAVGIVNDHDKYCHLYQSLADVCVVDTLY
ncbi:MAG: DNA-3-methyladenine glycosylase I [Clostridiales bacterium]|nr:DNA-3-methyladenine glycosylase I [Clostridiales bacterium]